MEDTNANKSQREVTEGTLEVTNHQRKGGLDPVPVWLGLQVMGNNDQ